MGLWLYFPEVPLALPFPHGWPQPPPGGKTTGAAGLTSRIAVSRDSSHGSLWTTRICPRGSQKTPLFASLAWTVVTRPFWTKPGQEAVITPGQMGPSLEWMDVGSSDQLPLRRTGFLVKAGMPGRARSPEGQEEIRTDAGEARGNTPLRCQKSLQLSKWYFVNLWTYFSSFQVIRPASFALTNDHQKEAKTTSSMLCLRMGGWVCFKHD